MQVLWFEMASDWLTSKTTQAVLAGLLAIWAAYFSKTMDLGTAIVGTFALLTGGAIRDNNQKQHEERMDLIAGTSREAVEAKAHALMAFNGWDRPRPIVETAAAVAVDAEEVSDADDAYGPEIEVGLVYCDEDGDLWGKLPNDDIVQVFTLDQYNALASVTDLVGDKLIEACNLLVSAKGLMKDWGALETSDCSEVVDGQSTEPCGCCLDIASSAVGFISSVDALFLDCQRDKVLILEPGDLEPENEPLPSDVTRVVEVPVEVKTGCSDCGGEG